MVKLPEYIPEDKLEYKYCKRTIDELGRKRISLAAKKIKENTYENIDYGFQTFEVRKAPILSLDRVIDFSLEIEEQRSFGIEEDSVAKYDYKGIDGIQTLLATWLLRDGYGRLAKADEVKLGNYIAYC
ncbi:hypothetical protein [Bacillus subtilis]|uniref:hypothetical protein n=1 Tax=Bacillus subtilis TaxID=1423 RepID=UPI0030EEB6EA